MRRGSDEHSTVPEDCIDGDLGDISWSIHPSYMVLAPMRHGQNVLFLSMGLPYTSRRRDRWMRLSSSCSTAFPITLPRGVFNCLPSLTAIGSSRLICAGITSPTSPRGGTMWQPSPPTYVS